jgi:hypothetical protein
MNNKIFFLVTLACVLIAGATVQAQTADYLWVNKTDGSAVSFNLNDLHKITFTDDEIVVNPTAGSAQSFAFGTVRKLTFENRSTAIAAPAEKTQRIFYNPASQSVVVDDLQKSGTLSIYSLTGSIVKTAVVQQGKTEISISGLPTGVYLVKSGETVKKIIKN